MMLAVTGFQHISLGLLILILLPLAPARWLLSYGFGWFVLFLAGAFGQVLLGIMKSDSFQWRRWLGSLLEHSSCSSPDYGGCCVRGPGDAKPSNQGMELTVSRRYNLPFIAWTFILLKCSPSLAAAHLGLVKC